MRSAILMGSNTVEPCHGATFDPATAYRLEGLGVSMAAPNLFAGWRRSEGLSGPKLDLLSLQYALLAREQGSFRAAAEFLGIQPSAVSRRVLGLEDALGVSLFQRRTRGAKPTRAGEVVFRRGRAILDGVLQLERTACGRGAGVEGSLCIGIVSSISGGRARELLATFITKNPSIKVEVAEGSPRDHLSSIRALRMDTVLAVEGLVAPGLDILPLWIEPILVALPAAHPLAEEDVIAWRQLAAERFLVSRADPGPEIYDFVVRNISALGRHPVVEAQAVGREGLMALVGLGLGVSLVSAAESAVAYPNIVFRPLGEERLPFCLIWSADNDNPAFRRFLSLARSLRTPATRPIMLAPQHLNGAPSRTPDRSP